MGAQKHGVKGGGFLHLFDWNAKSRKKLFSTKSESPEQPKQTKRTDGNMPMTCFNTIEEDDMIAVYSCTTSVTDEDGYVIKPPGVVARLMGLDSLPTVHLSDTYSNPSFDSDLELTDGQTKTVSRTTEVKVKPQNMVIHRAVEKFQTETFPPKSAKSIPVTRNKLLSPIKRSGFVSSNNPARIMEAAARIPLARSASPSPSVSTRKPRISESARGPLVSNVKNLKSQSSEPKKSISLALQAKANVQKRVGLNNHQSQPMRTQSNIERNQEKNPGSSTVLKQNNQKQNSLVDRGKSTPKSSCSNTDPQSRKPVSKKTSHKKEPYSKKKHRSNRSDVVSFTFTAPVSRPVNSNDSFLSNERSETAINSTNNDSNSNNNESLTCDGFGADALSALLEQKLRELTGSRSPTSVSQDSFLATETDIIEDSNYGFSSYKHYQAQDLMNIDDSSCGFSVNDPQEPVFHDYAYRKYLNGRQTSPDSVLEQSFNTESCNSSDTTDIFKQDSASVQARQLTATSPSPMDVDTDLLDSASSKWEPCYIKEVLENIEAMFVDFTIGKTRKVVNPRVFDQLELGRPKEKAVRLRRELWFNCVSECVETRCRMWAKGISTVRRPDRLAREVYEEIVGWKDMKDGMVDELVDKDMSGCGYKKWLEFDVEGFEIGVEIESWLLDSLINEVVDDILVL